MTGKNSESDRGAPGFSTDLRYLVLLALIGAFAISAVSFAVDATSEEIEDASDDVVTPFDNQPWWQHGSMPILLATGITLGLITLAGLTRRLARLAGEHIAK